MAKKREASVFWKEFGKISLTFLEYPLIGVARVVNRRE